MNQLAIYILYLSPKKNYLAIKVSCEEFHIRCTKFFFKIDLAWISEGLGIRRWNESSF